MSKVFDLRLVNTSSIVIAGPSLSGKSVFTRRLLEKDEILFQTPFQHKYWFSAYRVPEEERLENVEYMIGLPDNFDEIQEHSIIVLDDLMTDSQSNKSVTNLFTRGVHHRKLCVVLLTQNLYQEGSHNRTRNLNTHYLVLFRNPRNKQQVASLERQMFPRDAGYLINVYETATRLPYGYLFIDLHQSTNDLLRLRTNILPHESPMVVYISPKNTHKL